MPKITVYAGANCSYCVRAKMLLKKKGAAFEEIDVSANPERREEMIQKSGGRRTIPQIFIDDKLIGGCDDLYALDADGKLDPLLKVHS